MEGVGVSEEAGVLVWNMFSGNTTLQSLIVCTNCVAKRSVG